MYIQRQTFLVLGLSKSGAAAAEFLLGRGGNVYVYDDIASERVENAVVALEKKGARRVKQEELAQVSEICDALVLSPGIPIDHPLAVSFKRAKRAVIGETELAARYMRCPIIAVTGTNGKTTTVSMLAETLQKGGITAKACGNIGTPMLEYANLAENEVAVAEVSSFQLETLQSLRPHIAIVLNVTEDHLSRHYNMENYIFLKKKLLKNSAETEYAILNYDDPIVRRFGEECKAQVLWFSVKERVSGAFYEDGNLYCGKEKIMAVADLPVGGLHNVQNALAVIIAARLMGIKGEQIALALTEFKGIRHRIEQVATINGVTYIDDSKGTNVDATLKAIESMKSDTVLLLGGKHKGYDYHRLFTALPKSKVIHAVLYGENRFILMRCAREHDYSAFTLCEGFSFAVQIAALKAKEGQTVLLSPASASFDEFSNYEERGDRFVEIVRSFVPREADNEAEESDAEEGELILSGELDETE